MLLLMLIDKLDMRCTMKDKQHINNEINPFEGTVLSIVSLDQIRPNPYNDFPMEEMESLEATIKAFGILTPLLLVGPYSNGYYLILNGERRYRVAKKLRDEGDERFKTIPCYIPERSMSDNKQKLVIEIANIEHRNTNEESRTQRMFKIYHILSEMEASGDINDRAIASMAAKSLNCSDRYMRIFKSMYKNSLDELKDMVYQGDISVKNADVISRTSPEKQQQYIERIKQGEKSSDLVKEIKNEAKKEENERTVISHYNQMTSDLNGKIAVDIEAFKKSLMEDDYDPFGLEDIFETDVALASHDEEYFKKKFDLYDDEIYSDDEKYDKRDKELYERFRVWSNKVLSGECELDEYEKEIVEICIQIADKYEYLI